MSALDAQRVAHEIAFAPIVFQVSRLMIKFGIFSLLEEAEHSDPKGLTVSEVAASAKVSEYAAKVLLESSLTAGTVFYNDGRYTLSKIGWFLQNDAMVRADIDFNHDVNYLGLFRLEESLLEGKPEGLKVFGNWPTIYEGLSSLEPQVQKSWFGFDHFYSDNSFEEVLPTVFDGGRTKSILDIGGNTGRFALKCVSSNDNVDVTVMDLPQQLGMLRENVKGMAGAERIHTNPGNLLDPQTVIPGGFDVVWMSQFLDCFSEEQVVSILERVAKSAGKDTKVFIMETLWDRQPFDTASFDLAQTSIYFTALANGNSKMFFSEDLFRMIGEAGLKLVEIKDNIGYGHSLLCCQLAENR